MPAGGGQLAGARKALFVNVLRHRHAQRMASRDISAGPVVDLPF